MLQNAQEDEVNEGQPQDLDQLFVQAMAKFGPAQDRAIHHEGVAFDGDNTEQELFTLLTEGGQMVNSVTLMACSMILSWDDKDGGFLSRLIQHAAQSNSAENMVANIVFSFLREKPMPELLLSPTYWDQIKIDEQGRKEVITKNIVNPISNTQFTLTMTCDVTAQRKLFKQLKLEKVQNQAQTPTKAQAQNQAQTQAQAQPKTQTRSVRKTMIQLVRSTTELVRSTQQGVQLVQRHLRHFKSATSNTNGGEMISERIKSVEKEVEAQAGEVKRRSQKIAEECVAEVRRRSSMMAEQKEGEMEDVVLKEEDVASKEEEEEEE